MSQLGLGVMINMLGGNRESAEAASASMGKQIYSVEMGDDVLHLRFVDGTGLDVSDEGQSCCEHRYMTKDGSDDLSYYVGAELLSLEVRDAPDIEGCEAHECQFLDVKTSKGVFTLTSHNEHNGYYGGFSVRCSLVAAKAN